MAFESNRLGMPKDPWLDVYYAYQEANPTNLCPGDASKLASLAMQWEQDKNPSYMDAAISYCHQRELPILPALVKYLDAAMQKRIRDGKSANLAFRESAKQRMLEEMAKLIYHPATVERAADWAAASRFNRYKMKSSSLEKAYSDDKSRLDAFAKHVFESLKDSPE